MYVRIRLRHIDRQSEKQIEEKQSEGVQYMSNQKLSVCKTMVNEQYMSG